MTLCLKGEKEGQIVYSLTQENCNEESSVIPVISTHVADPRGSYWSELESSVVLSFQITVQSLHQVMDKEGSPVEITATETSVWFKVGYHITWIREKANRYQILRPSQESQDYPLIMEFHSFHPKDAIKNAAALAAENVIFHLTSDSRCVLQIFVNGVGSILFCFNAIRGQGSQFPSSPASSTLPA